MSKRWFPMFAGCAALGLAGCGTSLVTEHPSGTGPFDTDGNYIESWADNPEKWNGRSVPVPSAPSKPETAVASVTPPTRVPAPVVTPRTLPSSSTTTVTVSKPKPKPVAPKPKPKPPAATFHSVRKGDTLYGLAKRYGTTVGTIQKANGISGSTIRIGQRLKIPR